MESPFFVKPDQMNEEALTEEDRCFLLKRFVLEDPDLVVILEALQKLDLPDWRLVSGAVYQTVWNRLTGQSQGYGIKDFDIAYFDASDQSYEAEDAVIRAANAALPAYSERLEVRNQARVHLWYPERFGGAYPELSCTDESLENYMCTTHAVAVRLEADGDLSIAAPFGLEDIFSLTIRPCQKLRSNRNNYAVKAKRMIRLWPQLRVLDWESGQETKPHLLI